MKTILLVFQSQEISKIAEVFKGTGHKLITATSADEISLPQKFDFAFIDESFDGTDSGWILASKIRVANRSSKIVMLVHLNDLNKYNSDDYLPYYDWIMKYSTVSAEQILSEIERRWHPDAKRAGL